MLTKAQYEALLHFASWGINESGQVMCEHARADYTDEDRQVNAEKALLAGEAIGILSKLQDERVTIQIGMDGGLIQGITASHPVDVIVFDYDTDGSDPEDLDDVPQGGGETTRAWVGYPNVLVDPKAIAEINAWHDAKAFEEELKEAEFDLAFMTSLNKKHYDMIRAEVRKHKHMTKEQLQAGFREAAKHLYTDDAPGLRGESQIKYVAFEYLIKSQAA